MLEHGEFYPYKTMSAEERLWWYSRFFDAVEVNSTFYALPAADTAALWVARTQQGFIFNVKAYGLLTGHHVDADRLPDGLRTLLPAAVRSKHHGRMPNTTFGDDARAWVFAEMRKALAPLREAGKLGYVLFQLAPWVKHSDAAQAQLAGLRREFPDDVIAVEFRNRSWFGDRLEETLRLLAAHALTYVAIDGPRSRATIPSIPALTSPTAVFRLHGRNFGGHVKQLQGRAPTVAEKYDYLYREDELAEIARAAGAMNGKAERVHLAMNNNNRNYPVINGLQLKQMLLEDGDAPNREALIKELDERRSAGKTNRRRHGPSVKQADSPPRHPVRQQT